MTKDKTETALAMKSSKELNTENTINRLILAGWCTLVLIITAAPSPSVPIAARPPFGDNNQPEQSP